MAAAAMPWGSPHCLELAEVFFMPSTKAHSLSQSRMKCFPFQLLSPLLCVCLNPPSSEASLQTSCGPFRWHFPFLIVSGSLCMWNFPTASSAWLSLCWQTSGTGRDGRMLRVGRNLWRWSPAPSCQSCVQPPATHGCLGGVVAALGCGV